MGCRSLLPIWLDRQFLENRCAKNGYSAFLLLAAWRYIQAFALWCFAAHLYVAQLSHFVNFSSFMDQPRPRLDLRSIQQSHSAFHL